MTINVSFCQSTKELFTTPGLTYIWDSYDDTGDVFANSMFFKQDTVINDQEFLEFESRRFCGKRMFRIENRKIYYDYDLSSIGIGEILLYDFGLEYLDTIELTTVGDALNTRVSKYVVVDERVNYLGGQNRKKLTLSSVNNPTYSFEWIEGIGNVSSGFLSNVASTDGLVCVKDSSGIIHYGPNFNEEECTIRSCKEINPKFEQIEEMDEFVKFVNLSKNAPYSEWTFGDGNSGIGDTIFHTYEKKGCYMVSLNATNECGEFVSESNYYNYCADSMWVNINEREFRDISFISNEEGWAISQDTIFHTVDGGYSWDVQYIHIVDNENQVTLSNIHMESPDLGIVGIYNWNRIGTNTLITTNGGESWVGSEWEVGNLTGLRTVTIREDGEAYSSRGSSVYRSIDYGANWKELPLRQTFLPVIDMQYFGNGKIAVLLSTWSYRNSYIMISDDYGQTWYETHFDDYTLLLSIQFVNDSIGYVSSDNGIWKTTDSGKNWDNTIQFYDNRRIIKTHFESELEGIVVTDSHVLKTTNGGITWAVENCNMQTSTISNFEIVDSSFYMIQNKKLYKRLPEIKFSCETTSAKNPSIINKGFKVYPNPFTDFINIELEDNFGGLIKIYNDLGKEIYSENILTNSRIKINSLTSEMYIVHYIDLNGNIHYQKIIKME